MSIKITDNTIEVLNTLELAKKRGLEAIGMAAEGHAKKETPVDTGRLRNSITNIVEGDSAYIGTNVEYAIYVEEGVRGRAGAHMLRKAAANYSSEYKKIMKDSVENA